MDFQPGKGKSKTTEYPIVKPQRKVFFINDDLVRVIHINRAQNFIKFYNISQDKDQTMLYTDFIKHRKRAYMKRDVARLLDRSLVQLNRYIYDDMIERPTGSAPGGVRAWHHKSYYSEDYIFKIREMMSNIHRGRPRKDGLTSNNVISEQELRIRMGDAMMLYTKNSDGEMVPVWSETI
jgi:hypothetical protein